MKPIYLLGCLIVTVCVLMPSLAQNDAVVIEPLSISELLIDPSGPPDLARDALVLGALELEPGRIGLNAGRLDPSPDRASARATELDLGPARLLDPGQPGREFVEFDSLSTLGGEPPRSELTRRPRAREMAAQRRTGIAARTPSRAERIKALVDRILARSAR
ncbi:MAG: hypothetical protein JSV80_12280 [Acidobacteriota bacterium]|nr:MAG: hypothetical protein JSV80_12280 [Acidobacteriota bacterium]